MAKVYKSGGVQEHLLYVDPQTGEISESPNDTSLQAVSFLSANWELTDSLLGALGQDFRGAVTAVVAQPSGSEADGIRYLVAASPTGTFASFSQNQIVRKVNGVWKAEPAPMKGTALYRKDSDAFYKFNNDTFASGSWVLAISGKTSKTDANVSPLVQVGVDGMIDTSFLQKDLNLNDGTVDHKISGVAAPSAGSDAANKTYVLGQVSAEVTARDSAILVEHDRAMTAEGLLLDLAGTRLMTGALQMNTHKISGVVDPAAGSQEAATAHYVDGAISQEVTDRDAAILVEKNRALGAEGLLLDLAGTRVMTGALQMNTHKISGVVDPTAGSQEAATAHYVDAADALFLKLDGSRSMTGDLNAGGHFVTNIPATPVADSDAVPLKYLRDQLAAAGVAATWQAVVKTATLVAPPASPVTGDRYLVGYSTSGSAATGAWAGKDGQIAQWSGSAWLFTVPSLGMYIDIADETDGIYLFGSPTWNKKFFEKTTASGFLALNGYDVQLKNLASGAIILGDLNGAAQAVTPSGDVTMSNTGVNAIGANKVLTSMIADANVTTSKILDGNVTSAKLASDSVTTIKILDANVTTAKIADANVTTAKIADANVTSAKLASDSVTTIKILDGNVTSAKLADGSVGTAKLADGSVLAAKIGDHEVHGVKLNSDVAGVSLSYNGTSNAIDVAFADPANYGSTDSGKAVKAGDIAGTGAGQGAKAVGFDGTGQHYIAASGTSDAALKAIDNEMFRYEGAVAATTGAALVGINNTGLTYVTGTTAQSAISQLDSAEYALAGRVTALENQEPGAIYSTTDTNIALGTIVTINGNNSVLATDATSVSYAIGMAASAKDGAGKVKVFANGNLIKGLNLAYLTGSPSAGARLFLGSDGKMTTVMPSAPATRVWQIGILADAASLASAAVHLELKFIKVNA